MSTGYWWIGRPNFGDLLTPLLLAHFAQVEISWALRSEADLVMVGSLIDLLPDDWDGIVAGSGMLRGHKHPLPHANVMGVRGPLTAANMDLNPKEICIGDPGLLANELVQVSKEYTLGLVPHWSDGDLETRPEFAKYEPHIIRPSGDPLEVIREIGRCRKIVASSLHGIIVADAFGIPRRTEMTTLFEKEGGEYKFRDHAAAMGMDFEVGVTQRAPRYILQDRQHAIYDMLTSLAELMKET